MPYRVSKVLAHPLLLLTLGTAASAWVIPYIASQSNKRNLIHEESQKEAAKIIQSSLDVNRDLNGMMLSLEFFYKNNRGQPIKTRQYYAREQQKTMAEMQEQYRFFDRLAWWWPRDTRWEAGFLNFMPSAKLHELDSYGNAYDKNLTECTVVLDKLWGDLLRKPFDPRSTTLEKEISDTREKLRQMQIARNTLTEHLVDIFAPW